MLRITGYTDRWVYRPGEEIEVKVSSELPSFHARLIRHLGAIQTPDDWARKTETVADSISGPHPGRLQPIRIGSFFRAIIGRPLAGRALRLSLAVFPTSMPAAGSTLAVLQFSSSFSVALQVDGTGAISFAIHGAGGEPAIHPTGLHLALSRWRHLSFEIEYASGQINLAINADHDAQSVTRIDLGIGLQGVRFERLLLAAKATPDGFLGDFDGKIDGPLLEEIDDAGARHTIGRWDFASMQAGRFAAPDVTGTSPPGTFVNAPTRAVTSSRFNGRSNSFLEAPDQYDAVWFHRDDLADAEWETSLRIGLPENAAGVFSVVLSERADVNWQDRASFDAIPIFVRPARDSTARLALVLPTFSYRAYANNTFAEEADPRIFRRKKKSVSAPLYDYAIRHRLLSLYDRHSDDAGVCLASLKRPQVTIRADFDSQLQGFAHQFSADLAIVEWLNGLNMPFDILTDEMLHDDGVEAIGRYDVLLSGSHPEYSSYALLNAYDDFADAGGSILYLGGNGFYWSVGMSPDHPDLLEVRRSEGTRTWTAAPGERRQQLDGRDGGLWRSLGRPPNRTFGVGFSAHGFSGDGHYRALPDLDPTRLPTRLRAFFSAVGDNSFGVAGLELDRYAPEYGSARDVIVLAAAEGMPYGYLPTVEELGGLDELIPDPEGALARLVRGNVTLYRHPGGGMIFSVGSIRWTSGLLDPEDGASVRELTTAALLDLLGEADVATRRL